MGRRRGARGRGRRPVRGARLPPPGVGRAQPADAAGRGPRRRGLPGRRARADAPVGAPAPDAGRAHLHRERRRPGRPQRRPVRRGARRRTRSIAEPGHPAAVRPGRCVWNVLDVVEAAVRSGHLDEARAPRGGRPPRRSPRSRRGCAFQAAAAAALVAPAGAHDAFDRVVDDPGSLRWPFHLARVELAYGERLRLGPCHAPGADRTSSARWSCSPGSAPAPGSERTEAALRATGRTRAATAGERPGLTPQELRGRPARGVGAEQPARSASGCSSRRGPSAPTSTGRSPSWA